MNARGEKISKPSVIVSGFHEDFPAAVSPNGRWIAFHSHRSKVPVPEYGSAGSTDDIYLRRAADLHAPEIRLTDFGWETGPAFWSPDGRKLLFVSWGRGGVWGIDHVWTITLDPQTGRVLRERMLPLPTNIRSAQWASWSPDGREIAIEDDRGGEDRSLWITDADGSHGRKVLEGTGCRMARRSSIAVWRLAVCNCLPFRGKAGNRISCRMVPGTSCTRGCHRTGGGLLAPISLNRSKSGGSRWAHDRPGRGGCSEQLSVDEACTR